MHFLLLFELEKLHIKENFLNIYLIINRNTQISDVGLSYLASGLKDLKNLASLIMIFW